MKIIKKHSKAKLSEATENTQLPELTAANIKSLFDHIDVTNPPEEAEVEAMLSKADTNEGLKQLDTETLEECLNSFLTESFKQIEIFNISDKAVKNGCLFVEGNVTFRDGRVKATSFEFSPRANNILIGRNTNISEDLKLSVAYHKTGNKLVTEGLKYSYKSGTSLIEGLSKI